MQKEDKAQQEVQGNVKKKKKHSEGKKLQQSLMDHETKIKRLVAQVHKERDMPLNYWQLQEKEKNAAECK